MPCYYCTEPFQPKDIAVKLDLVKMEPQDHGGLIAQHQETAYAHPNCVGNSER